MVTSKEELAEKWCAKELGKSSGYSDAERKLLFLWIRDAYLAGYEAGQPKWITTEQMTEEYNTWEFGDYVALRRNNETPICAQVTEGEQYGDGTCGISLMGFYGNDLYIEDFTHWIPLPTLPTEEK